jgi:hypothetical protein
MHDGGPVLSEGVGEGAVATGAFVRAQFQFEERNDDVATWLLETPDRLLLILEREVLEEFMP